MTLTVLVAASLLAAAPAPPDLLLVQVPAAETGVTVKVVCGSHTRKTLILEENGSGAALFDYDGDGDLDLYVVNGGTLESVAGREPPPRDALYRNDGGWRFVDVTGAAGVGDPGWGTGVAAGDVDGDGALDLFVAGWGPDVLFLNRGDGTFREAAVEAGVADPAWGHSAAFLDFDGDADLDLYVTNNLEIDPANPPQEGRPCAYRGLATACGPVGLPPQPDRLFRNDGAEKGASRFTDVSATAGIHAPAPQYGLGVVAADLDGDGWVDLAVANDSGPNFLFRNRGDATFEETAWLAGVATQAEGRFQAGMGIDAGDADGDGRLDLFVTNFALDHSTLYLAQGPGLYRDASYPSGLGGPTWVPMSWGTRFVDFDLDSDLDLYVANGHLYPEVDAAGQESYRQPDGLFENDGRGRFADVSAAIRRRGPPEVSRGAAFGDLDGDGDADAVVVELEASPTLLRNDSQTGRTVAVRFRGGPGGTGEGATIVADVVGPAGARRLLRPLTTSGSYASASEPVVRLGLGDDAVLDRLEVRWPPRRGRDGVATRRVHAFRGLPAGRELVVYEGRPASSPASRRSAGSSG